jgi:hypothetical protein
MAFAATSSELPQPFIELVDNDDEWFVRVVANGRETVNTFSTERFARTYAEEQRIRLGVKEIQRV